MGYVLKPVLTGTVLTYPQLKPRLVLDHNLRLSTP